MGLSVWAPDIDKVMKKFVSSENMHVNIYPNKNIKQKNGAYLSITAAVEMNTCIRFWSKWAKIGYKGIAGSVV